MQMVTRGLVPDEGQLLVLCGELALDVLRCSLVNIQLVLQCVHCLVMPEGQPVKD